MAYAHADVKTTYRLGGRNYILVTITETGLTGITNEHHITGLPAICQVVSVVSTLTIGGGTATQVDPQLGDKTNSNNVFENTTPSAATREYPSAAISTSATQDLYWRAKCDGTTGVNGGVVSRVVLVEGLK